MVDLGAGVHLVPDEPAPDPRRGPAGPPQKLTCPLCLAHDGHQRVDHPGGTWLCACGQLFFATTPEWWRLKTAREHFYERRKRGLEGVTEAPAATSTNPTSSTRAGGERGAP